MKKSQLRLLIKEEIKLILDEASSKVNMVNHAKKIKNHVNLLKKLAKENGYI